MKSDLQVKFLSFMTGRKKGEGFTLIELLVVIIIIGILAAIALPSFLNQANKAKQSEAKSYVGTLVRSQQAYYLEKADFASSIAALGSPIAASTTNYSYVMATSSGTGATAVVSGNTQRPALRSYSGMVQLGIVTATSEATTLAVLCETVQPGVTAIAPTAAAAASGAAPTCPATTTNSLNP